MLGILLILAYSSPYCPNPYSSPDWAATYTPHPYSSSSSCNCSHSPQKRSVFDLIANIHNLMPVKLDRTEDICRSNDNNYLRWKHLIVPILRAYNLVGNINGSLNCPKFVNNSMTKINPSYETWYLEDQAVMVVLNATISHRELGRVLSCQTSKELWDKINQPRPEFDCLIDF